MNTERDQETSGSRAHTSERVNGGGTTEDKHGRDDDVGHEAEEDEHLLHAGAPTSIDDLADGVGIRRVALDLDREHTEKQDLNGRAGGVPERTRDAILVGDVGGLEEGRRPGPLGDDDGGRQTGLNVAAGGVEEFGGEVETTVALVKLHDDAGGEGEEHAEADHDAVTRALRKDGLAAEERILAGAGRRIRVVLRSRGVVGAVGRHLARALMCSCRGQYACSDRAFFNENRFLVAWGGKGHLSSTRIF